ncbi:hypothetical protein JHK85_022748 [Glycine max]|nr:hypothetical protein JHK85_022748 [Glycine max]
MLPSLTNSECQVGNGFKSCSTSIANNFVLYLSLFGRNWPRLHGNSLDLELYTRQPKLGSWIWNSSCRHDYCIAWNNDLIGRLFVAAIRNRRSTLSSTAVKAEQGGILPHQSSEQFE